MNVYEKLTEARKLLQKAKIKQSGKNEDIGYSYYELADFLPEINKICDKLKACCIVSFTRDLATLFFVDSENPSEKIEFSCPMSTAKLSGCLEVQNAGAVQTYLKRYLYQNCFEIADKDIVNKNQKQSPKKWNLSETQRSKIVDLMNSKINGLDIFSEESKAIYREKLKNCLSDSDFNNLYEEAEKIKKNCEKSFKTC